MFNSDADLFFADPAIMPTVPGWVGVLHLLRRDIYTALGIDPSSGSTLPYQVLWPGAMAILAGVDLLAKFLEGSDAYGRVGQRFKLFIGTYFVGVGPTDREVIYQLRNSLLHSFGLYSKDNHQIYRFFLVAGGTGQLSKHRAPDKYFVDLRVLHKEFENAIQSYATQLDSDTALQKKFNAMYQTYGKVYLG